MSRIWTDNGALYLQCPYEDKHKAKSVPGDGWRKRKQAWKYPMDIMTFKVLCAKWPNAEIDPGTLESFTVARKEFNRAETTRAAAIQKPDETLRDFLAYPFFDHQLKSFTYFKDLEKAVDFSDPGTGKTLVQLALIKHRILEHGVKKILIVCPLGIIEPVWAREIVKFIENFPLPIHPLNVSVDKACELLEKDLDGVYIINYEKTWRMQDWLTDFAWDFVIFDESSRLKTYNAKQTQTCTAIAKGVRFKSIMTGTPAPNTFLELFSQIRIIDDRLFGNSFYAYKAKYFEPSQFNEFDWTIRRGADAEIKRLSQVFGMAWKKEQCLDLPKLTVQRLDYELSDEQKKAYKTMAEEMVATLNAEEYQASVVLTKILRLSQITSGFIQETEGEALQFFKVNPKLNLLMEVLSDIPKERKVIIWAVYHADMENLKGKLGEAAVTYYGAMNAREKNLALDKFINDPDIRYFIAHPKSAGMGLNLTVANYSVFYSKDYSFEAYAQSRERFNRPGQELAMTEYHLVAPGTVDVLLLDALKTKQKINDFITTFKETHGDEK